MLTKKNIHAYQLNISFCVKTSAGYSYNKLVSILLLTVFYSYSIEYKKVLPIYSVRLFLFFVPQRWILFFISFFYNGPVDDIPKCGDMVRSFVLIV
jgi:hypothetical protein